MFKLALGAGHRLYTAGKRIPAYLDPNETREWVLNDRICDKIQRRLAQYDGIEVLRVDDTEGERDISVAERNTAANNWDADFALAIHHNAGINGGAGGGIVAYVAKVAQAASAEWQAELYAALIEHTGLRGNRASPLATAYFQMLTGTRMPAVLLELGFMDSTTDVPIILTDEYADQCAAAIVEVIVRRAGLTPKETGDQPAAWAKEAAEWCVEMGIINGDGNGRFGWKDTVTKEMAAQLLYNFAGAVGVR